MKKVLSIAMILVLAGTFGVTVMAEGDPHPDTHECWNELICDGGACVGYKCCEDCVWNYDTHHYDCVTDCVVIS